MTRLKKLYSYIFLLACFCCFLTRSVHYVVTGTPVHECCSASETCRGLISGKRYQTVFNLNDNILYNFDCFWFDILLSKSSGLIIFVLFLIDVLNLWKNWPMKEKKKTPFG